MMTDKNHINEERMHAYLDQEIGAEDQRVIEAHLTLCAQCKREIADLRVLFQQIESIPEEGFQKEIASAVLHSISTQTAIPIRFRVLAVLQGVTAVLLLGLLWPVIQSSVLDISSSLRSWDLDEWIQEGLITLQPVLTEAVDQIRGWAETLLLGLELNVPVWPISNWWFVVLGGLFLWLISNGFLLTRYGRQTNGD
jgi:hypothetical protein